jgi:ribose transport system permease protein
MKRNSWADLMTRYPALFALILLLLAILINVILQPKMFDRDTLNSNMRVFLPIILLAAGQAVVILGGGIDISVGGIVSIAFLPPGLAWMAPRRPCGSLSEFLC